MTTSWKLAAAAVRGESHERRGEPCQDAFAHRRRGDWLIAAVCDGAGSAARSDEGARHGAETVCERLLAAVDGFAGADFDAFWRAQVIEAVAAARRALPGGEAAEPALSDYHATLVGVVADASRVLLFHIGDGVAAAVKDGGWARCTLSLPENGEYANETFFYTQPNWRERLRFTPAEAVDELFLMSDGAASFTLARDRAGLDARFAAPVARYLAQADEATGSQALAGTLDHAQARAVTGDDKTLLWAKRLATCPSNTST